MDLDQLETYLAAGAPPEIIAASLIFLHDYSNDQAEHWIAERQPALDRAGDLEA